MLKFANKLSDDYEYAIIWWGQSNARPQGNRDTEGFVADPMLGLPTAGQRITVTAKSGSTVTVSDTLTADQWIGAKIRFVTTYPGTSIAFARVGYGTVTDNTAIDGVNPATLTVSWDAEAATLTTVTKTVTFDNTTETLTAATHPFNTGDAVRLTTDNTLPAELATGTTYYVIKTAANTFQLATSLANAIAGTALTFTDDGTGTHTCTLYSMSCYVYFDDSYRQYPNIRVLTPYIPETPGAYPSGVPSVPGYTFPNTVETYEHAGLFLPYAWDEGVEGYSESGTASATSASTLTESGAGWTTDIWSGAVVLAGSSYATVASNDTDTLTLTSDGWTGGTPSSTAAYRIIIPHYLDNPRRHLPGFRYPSNETQPGGDAATAARATGSIYNRTASNLVGIHNTVSSSTYSWTYQFGAMLPFAWRLANKLGKRINIIPLAVNSSVLTQSNGVLGQGYKGTIGWYNPKKNDWTPSKTGSLAERLEDLVTVVAPAALTAEGNTKPLRILGICGFQGESDSISDTGRNLYAETLRAFYAWLRGKIVDAGLSPYASSVQIPVVHASLPTDRWENASYDAVIKALYGSSFGIDEDGVTNAAIAEFAAKDGFAATIDTDDSDARYDVVHFNGAGEERNGRLAAEAMGTLVNKAVSMGSDPGAVAICNLALSNIGDSAKITSIDPVDGSAQSTHCARFYPIARDSLLEMKQWSFASKRVALTSVDNTITEWDYAYVVPSDVLCIVAVLPPSSTDDYSVPIVGVLGPNSDAASGSYIPQPYAIEQDDDGNQILYTDQENAVLRYTAKVTDTAQFPSLFKMALSWHLAGMLAGPIIKGDQGAAEAKRCQMMMAQYLSRAETSDGNQRQVKPQHIVPWMQNR